MVGLGDNDGGGGVRERKMIVNFFFSCEILIIYLELICNFFKKFGTMIVINSLFFILFYLNGRIYS